MTGAPTLVLLSGFGDPTGSWAAVQAGLGDAVQILTPPLAGLSPTDSDFTLQRSAAGMATALAAAGHSSATVCGVGLGAMVALQLAADSPERVDDLVLITRQVRSSAILLSLPAAVLPLIPASWVVRLGAQQDQVLALLDQVRPVDFTSTARRVSTPALVLCGDHDVINRRTSATLARELRRGDLQTVPDAGPGWLRSNPEKLVRLLLARLHG
ncbi:MAG: alpha/beta hydrolase [Propionibacteriaceae bacterium]